MARAIILMMDSFGIGGAPDGCKCISQLQFPSPKTSLLEGGGPSADGGRSKRSGGRSKQTVEGVHPFTFPGCLRLSNPPPTFLVVSFLFGIHALVGLNADIRRRRAVFGIVV